jgi:hypothetical protein
MFVAMLVVSVQGPGSLESVQNLLLRGKRTEAVKEAISGRDFATALLVASMCGRETYQNAAKQYAEQVFFPGSPLYTVALLFAGELQAPMTGVASSHWGGDSSELIHTWKRHLAAIISNRTVGWDRIVLSLGDRLKECDDVQAAHFCYMVSGGALSNPVHQDSRIALLGCDHTDSKNCALMTEDAIFAYDRTESYEWAKRRGNPDAAIESFQPFKLVYAMLLADLGHEDTAELLCHSVRQCSNFELTELLEKPAYHNVLDLFEDRNSLACALSELEDRLRFRKDPNYRYELPGEVDNSLKRATKDEANKARTASSGQSSSGGSNSSRPDQGSNEAKKNTMSKNTEGGAMPSTRSTPNVTRRQDALAKYKNESKTQTVIARPFEYQPQDVRPDAHPQDPGADASFVSAKSNLLDVTGYSIESPDKGDKSGRRSTAQNITEAEKAEAMPKSVSSQFEEPQMESLLSRSPKPHPANRPQAMHVTPQDLKKSNDKLMTPPMSAPAVMLGEKSKTASPRKAAPSTSEKNNSWGLGFRGKMIKWLNPDAHEVKLEESADKAYYDEKRKVWVFPGDNPDELAKPIGAPPTIPAAGPSTPGPTVANESKTTPNDPFAALMAPPKRAPSSFKRPGAPGGNYTPRGHPGISNSAGMASPLAATPPQFAVFKPKPSTKEEQKSD